MTELYELKETVNNTTGKVYYYIKTEGSRFARVSRDTFKSVEVYAYMWGRISCITGYTTVSKTTRYMTAQTPSKVFALIGHKTLG